MADFYVDDSTTQRPRVIRRFLGTLPRGALVSLPTSVEAALISVDGILESIDSADAHLSGHDLLPWMRLLERAVLKAATPRRPHDLVDRRVGPAVVSGNHEITWIVATGDVFLYGRRSGVSRLEAKLWPLLQSSWVLLESESSVRPVEPMSAGDRTEVCASLERFVAMHLRMLMQDAGARDTVERRRLRSRLELDQDRMSESCHALAAVLAPESDLPRGSDPLESAVARVAADRGIELGSIETDRKARATTRLREISRTNHFRMRRVALRGRWWKSEGESLLAARAGGKGRPNRPVALRPTGSGYVIWDPEEDVEFAVDDVVAAELSPFAYAFYRRMPDEPFRLRGLAGYAMEGNGREVWVVTSLGFVAGGLAAMIPVLTGKVYDYAIPEASRTQLIQLIALLLCTTVVSVLLQLVRAFAALRAETRLDAALQAGIWDRLLALPARFFREYTAGDLAMRASGFGQIRMLLSSAATSALLTGLFSVWYLGLLFYYDVRLALWVLAAILLISAVSASFAWVQLRHQRRATAIQSRLSGLVLQLITGISKLRVAGAEMRAFARWANGFAAQRRAAIAAKRAGNHLAAVQAATPVFLLALTYAMLSFGTDDPLSTGSFLAFQTALLSLTGAIGVVTVVLAAVSSATPLFEQLQPILQADREADVRSKAPGELSGAVEMRHITFRYEPGAAPVLDDVSIQIRAGSFVAFVGPSGSGKSTLLRLMLGFESPESGGIYFDGQDMTRIDVTALRRQFGVVLQEAGILAGDIFTNIAGASDATLEDAWEAARLAGLADDIKAMPMGMHTVIDQNGTTISGGQRQRLMIARAIVTRPRILLFDEATSALDNVTQSAVSRSLAGLHATRIVIAHRLSTIVDADDIYVLDHGRIVERGTYATLVARDGLFARLARRQLVAA